MKNRIWITNFTVLLGTSISAASGAAILVGSGGNQADLYIEWSDGYRAEFTISFEEPTVTGLGLFDILEQETSLTTIRGDFGFGVFVDGISYEGHTNAFYEGGENWWHYWIYDVQESSWNAPMFGVADRIITHGDADGWIYGHAGAPYAVVPLPATFFLGILGLGMSRMIGKQRKRNAPLRNESE